MLQVPHERVARRRSRWTCVSISIGITVLPARFTRVAPAGTRTSAARAGLDDPGALHDQRRVLDHAPVADDQPRAFERGDGLRGRRERTPARTPRVMMATTAATVIRCMGASLM